MVYLVILGSGARLEHVIEMINSWRPEEEIYVEYLNRNIKRLECFEEHYRYYMGGENRYKARRFYLLSPPTNTANQDIPREDSE